MKIGILTHCVANNFGANLQALSTAMYLKKNGFTPFFLYWDEYLKKRNSKMDCRQLEIHRSFLVRQGISVSTPCRSINDFKDVIEKNEIYNIIVGSDAVLTVSSWMDRLYVGKKGIWLRKVDEDMKYPNPFWIPFSEMLSHCHFYYLSPSCQSSNYKFLPKRILKNMKNQMLKFDFLCARDTCTKQMMEYILGKNINIPITPDPVWGIGCNDVNIPTQEEIRNKYNIKKDYFLASFYQGHSVSADWLDSLRLLVEADEAELYSLPMPQGHFESNLPQINLPIDPLEWFALIKYSKGYIGNNMHPIIVAIQTRVPFFSIDQHGKRFWRFLFEKSSKVYDLLKEFDMLNYRVKQTHWNKISPQEVYSKLKEFPLKRNNEIAQRKEEDYLVMMDTICNRFIKNEKF